MFSWFNSREDKIMVLLKSWISWNALAFWMFKFRIVQSSLLFWPLIISYAKSIMSWSIAYVHIYIFLHPNSIWKCKFVLLSMLRRNSGILFVYKTLRNKKSNMISEFLLTSKQIGIFKKNFGTKICEHWIKPFGIRNKQRPKK